MSEIDKDGNIIGMQTPRILIDTDDDDPNYVNYYSFEQGNEKIFMFIYRKDTFNEVFEIPLSAEALVALPEQGFENASDYQEAMYPEITDKFTKYGIYNMDDIELSKAYHSMVMFARTNHIYTFGYSSTHEFETNEELVEYLTGLELIEESYVEFIPTFEGNLVNHAKSELLRAEMITKPKDKNDIDAHYNNMVAKNVLDLIDTFSKAGHSGFSASMTRAIFDLLSGFKTLTPITNDPEEWEDVSSFSDDEPGTLYQNKRDSSFFSYDGLKTWQSVDENTKHEIIMKYANLIMPIVNINEVIEEHGTKSAAGILLIARVSKQLLLGKRSKEDAEAGTWGLITLDLNTKINNNEEAKDETLKLFREQFGYTGNIELNEILVNTADDFRFYNYIGIVDKEFMPQLNWEIEKYQWFTYEDFIAANDDKLHYGVKILKEKSIDQIKNYIV